jgi:hypothetical protein
MLFLMSKTAKRYHQYRTKSIEIALFYTNLRIAFYVKDKDGPDKYGYHHIEFDINNQ